MIKAILIDDEVHCLDTLSMLITDFCPEVQVMEQCRSAKQGLEAVAKYQPAIIFLDIEMPVMNGFEFLEQLKEINFAIIFTTSYDQYAIKAIFFVLHLVHKHLKLLRSWQLFLRLHFVYCSDQFFGIYWF